jgi:two-component system cell cycle sensor histidine kinase PleC
MPVFLKTHQAHQQFFLKMPNNSNALNTISATEFLSAIVHELKTPISAIMGLADLLKDELKTVKANNNFNSHEFNEYLQDISLVAGEMNELVGDILDVESAALSGNFSVDLSREIDLSNVIKRSVKLNYDYSLKRSVAIKTEIADDIKPIKLDAKRLKQILTNLISNAVKYSPENSEVKITAKNLSQNNQEFLQICVIDQGFGMTQNQIATAFEKYQTIQNPNSGSVDSFGLGLPITKQLVSLQNGKIDVKSQPNQGTQMTLTFPYLM